MQRKSTLESLFTIRFVSLSKVDVWAVHTALVLAFRLGYFYNSLPMCICIRCIFDCCAMLGCLFSVSHHKRHVCKMPCQAISCSTLKNASGFWFQSVAFCPDYNFFLNAWTHHVWTAPSALGGLIKHVSFSWRGWTGSWSHKNMPAFMWCLLYMQNVSIFKKIIYSIIFIYY